MNGTELHVGDSVHATFEDMRVNAHREFDAIVKRVYLSREQTSMLELHTADGQIKHVSTDSPYMSYTLRSK